MEDIMSKGIATHPALLREITEFQQEHRVDAAQLVSLENELKNTKTQLKDVLAALHKSEKQVQTLSDKLNKANQDIGNLRTDVKKLMGKVF